MAKTLLGPLRLARLAADPSTPQVGWTYFNTASNKVRCYTASGWVAIPGTGGGGGGPNPTDDFFLKIIAGETIPGLTDATSMGFIFPESNPTLTDAVSLKLTSSETVPVLSDALTRLGITIGETVPAVSDAVTFLLNLALTESNAALTELLKLDLRGLGDSISAPSDAQSATATWRQGATTAASTGTNAWTSPANAQGLKDASNATSADASAIATWASALKLDPYPDPDSSFGSWTISTVKIYEYASYTPGTLPDAGSWKLQYRLSAGAYSTAESINTAFNSLTTPKVFDITAAKPGGGAWTWADLNTLNTNVIYNSAPVETSSAAVDAIEIEVVATKNPI